MIEMVQLEKIVVPPERQRKTIDGAKIVELAEGIAKVGLLQPITVRDDGVTLVAGERRFNAIKHLHFMRQGFDCGGKPVPPETVPVIRISNLGAAGIFEAELLENVAREDLHWRDRAEAMAKLAELRGMQKGAPVTMAELAEEIHGRSDGSFQDNIRQSIIVAKHLDNPKISTAKTVKEAIKILRMDEQQRKFADIGARMPSEVLKDKHRLLVGDFREQELFPNTYSVIITDPPYGIDMNKTGQVRANTTAGHVYDDSEADWQELMVDLAEKSWEVAEANAHIYLFCDLEKFYELKRVYEDIGFRVWSTPFIMYRKTSVRAPWQECGPWKSYECILYAMKGSRSCNMWRTDVIEVRGDENLGHGAQKPVAIYTDLLERSAKPGDSVLDLCCGTGPIFPAAHALKLEATGIELDPSFAAIAAKRLEELK